MLETHLKLDHCVIHVSDWERSNDFYAQVLGAELARSITMTISTLSITP
jgi:catechol 2,3-dioxygenase-like lactoylglutathione lyase family enzyme